MLPAGVLLTQRYHVPSYTSTLLMRKVPFLKTSNRESCSTEDVPESRSRPTPHHHLPGGQPRGGGKRALEVSTEDSVSPPHPPSSNPRSHLRDEHLVSVPGDCGFGCGLGQAMQVAWLALLQLAVLGLLQPRGHSLEGQGGNRRLTNTSTKPTDPIPRNSNTLPPQPRP